MFFRRNKNSTQSPEPATAPKQTSANALSRRFHSLDERPTTLLQDVRPPATESASRAPARKPITEEAATRILSEVQSQPIPPGDPMQDPPVGWLVVVEGPGKGNAVQIGYGMNSLGRASTQRVRLDFGDERLSRENHAQLTYDGQSRRFFIQHGGGPNLTYLDKEPVLTPTPLKAGDQIRLGSTTLRFVPLCDSSFDWLA